jgi:hypothetical protein
LRRRNRLAGGAIDKDQILARRFQNAVRPINDLLHDRRFGHADNDDVGFLARLGRRFHFRRAA